MCHATLVLTINLVIELSHGHMCGMYSFCWVEMCPTENRGLVCRKEEGSGYLEAMGHHSASHTLIHSLTPPSFPSHLFSSHSSLLIDSLSYLFTNPFSQK